MFKDETIELLESIRSELTERQKKDVDLAGFSARDGDGQKKARPGAFKVPTSLVKDLKKMGVDIDDQMLFAKVQKHIKGTDRRELPKMWGKDNMPDAQDFIADKPKKAFQFWLRNLKSSDAKMHSYLKKSASNVPLVYFAYMKMAVGDMMAKQIFKRYFESMSDHAGAAMAKRKKSKNESIDLSEGLAKGYKIKNAPTIKRSVWEQTKTAKGMKEYIGMFNNASFEGVKHIEGGKRWNYLFRGTNSVAKKIASEAAMTVELIDPKKSLWLAHSRIGTGVKVVD